MSDSPLVTQVGFLVMSIYIVSLDLLRTLKPSTVNAFVSWLFIHPMFGLHMPGKRLTGNTLPT